MRLLMLTPLLALAACSETSQPVKAEAEAEAPAPDLMSAGRWQMTSAVTTLTQRDKGAPAIKAAKGDKTVRSVCVAEKDVKQPPAALIVPEGFDCTYRDSYISGGRLNATMACARSGLSGNIAIIVNGSFKADSIEAISITETSLYGEGDVRIDSKLTGKRTGPC